MGVCCLRFGFRACFLALLIVADLIVVALAIPARTPLLTGAKIGATVDKAGTPNVAKRMAIELGFAKMLSVVLGHTLLDSEISYHNTSCVHSRRAEHCDRYVLVLRCFSRLHPFP